MPLAHTKGPPRTRHSVCRQSRYWREVERQRDRLDADQQSAPSPAPSAAVAASIRDLMPAGLWLSFCLIRPRSALSATGRQGIIMPGQGQ